MKWHIANTWDDYETLFALADRDEKRENFFRYTLMSLFEPMWSLIQVPMAAAKPGGYDVVMAADMLGYLNLQETSIGMTGIEKLREINIKQIIERTLHHCMESMGQAGLEVKAERLVFGTFLADPEKLAYTNGYSGFGGIPGYIQLIIYPNDDNIPRIPSIIAHEFHHNIRFSYFDWDHGNVSLGEYIVIEGLADSFASALYGEEMSGPWITSFDEEELSYSTEVIRQALNVKGFAEVSSYMYGDVIAREQGYQPVGLSFGAGYAVGYQTVQAFLKNTGMSIYDATRLTAAEIIAGSSLF